MIFQRDKTKPQLLKESFRSYLLSYTDMSFLAGFFVCILMTIRFALFPVFSPYCLCQRNDRNVCIAKAVFAKRLQSCIQRTKLIIRCALLCPW